MTVTIDFETYSHAGYEFDPDRGHYVGINTSGKPGLPFTGAAVYSEHPSTEVLCMAYDMADGAGPRLWIPGMAPPSDLFVHIAQGGLVEAHNSSFEYLIWRNVCHARMGWPALPLEQLRDSMAAGRAHSLPGQLEKMAEALDAPERKDADGTRLLRKFSEPRRPTKKNPALRLLPDEDPVDGPKLYGYCLQDVRAEVSVSGMLPPLSAEELELWLVDQRINQRGVAVDVEAVGNCVSIVEQATERYTAELVELTGGTVASAGEIAKLTGWLGGVGVHTASLDAEHLEELLSREDLPPEARRAVEIRQALSLASVKKLYALQAQTCADGRVRGLLAYHGAHTGRWTGGGPQPQNLPSSGPDVNRCPPCGRHYRVDSPSCPWCLQSGGVRVEWGVDAVADALQVIACRELDIVERFFGDALATVSGCLRGLFCAVRGHSLMCSDYSAIEGVVSAVLAGEEWRVDVFKTHGKIYEMGASKITGIPFEEFIAHKERTGDHHPMRKKIGKVSELASGFGGWVGSWKAFGAGEFMDDDEIKRAVLAWRAASPAIVEMWGGQHRKHPEYWQFTPELYGLEGAFIMAVQNPGTAYGYRDIRYQVSRDVLYCRLPSGRCLTYHAPRLHPVTLRNGQEGFNLSHMGIDPKTKQWTRKDTYGGRLFENVVQATARDILAHALVSAESAGYPVVLHVHDELVAEVPDGFGSVEELEGIMGTMPPWAAGWPIRAAGGWRGQRYRKD